MRGASSSQRSTRRSEPQGFTDRFYQKVCSGQLAPVLDTLVYLKHETNVWLEVTTLLIPGENDSPAELEAMSCWFAENLGPEVPWHFTAFHPDWRMLDKPPTPATTLRRARTIARSHGLHHVYVGNVHDEEGQSTTCASCGTLLIGRDGYDITAWHLDSTGRCHCGARCPGGLRGFSGRLGARRMPVRLAEFAAEATV